MSLNLNGLTYGAEFELADFDRRRGLVAGMAYDERDDTMCNSTGVAVDPKGQIWHMGGEVLARPADTPAGVAEQLAAHMELHPETTVNYRSNLHTHVRVPGLREDLDALKRLQRRVHLWMPMLLPIIEPIPSPTHEEYPDREAYAFARRRYQRRLVSHQKLLGSTVVERQLAASTVEEFFNAEALHVSSGNLYWATCPRACVNLRQLLQTDTVELRHFPGTTSPEEVQNAVAWTDAFVKLALSTAVSDEDGLAALTAIAEDMSSDGSFPSFMPYSHRMEQGYLLTSIKHNSRAQAAANIPAVLAWGLGAAT